MFVQTKLIDFVATDVTHRHTRTHIPVILSSLLCQILITIRVQKCFRQKYIAPNVWELLESIKIYDFRFIKKFLLSKVTNIIMC